MNIFARELKANFRSLIIWGVIVVLFITVGFSKFSAYYENPELLAVLDSMPPAMLAAFSLDAFNLTTVTGFLGVMFAYFTLLLSIAAAMWGSDIIAKEERDNTVEFSLTLPVKRSKLITAKTLAAMVNCIGLAIITWVATVASAQQYQPDTEFYNFLFLGVTTIFVLQMIFLAVGVFLGSAMKHYKRASSAAVSVLLGTYFLSIVSGLSEDLVFLRYFSPFKYFNPVTLLNESRIEVPFLLLSAAIIITLLAGAYLTYSRRDLYI